MKNVDTKHSEYQERYPDWEAIEHAMEGQREIHEQGTKILPRLSGQTDDEYKSYKQAALWFNATARTIDGLTGMLFLKPPVIEQTGMDAIVDDITMSGLSLHQFAEIVAEQAVALGRCGVLVDYPPLDVGAITLADAQQLGARPYATMYTAESIINWKIGRINNKQSLNLVVLEEESEIAIDEFKHETVEQWRVLDLENGAYRQRVFQKDKRGEFQIISEIYPQMNGKTMSFIPFEFIGIRDNTPCVDKPAILDLVDVNYSHYRTMAQLENGRAFTGSPQAWVAGVHLEAGTKLSIGSTNAWVFPDPQSSANYLEFTGKGLEELRIALAEKEAMMAMLGARMLAPEKKAAEAAQTASIHRAGENSVLASISQSISIGLTHILEWLRDWSGGNGNVKITLNREFMPQSMTAQDLQALVTSWQSGAISHLSLFELLKKGDIIANERNFDDEKELITMNPVGGALL